MKKLLSTSAILGALAISAGAANAANLQVNVGGFLDFQAGYTSDDVIGQGADQRNEINFNNDTEVHFTVEGKSDNGLEYGAVIELEADISANPGDNSDNGTNADNTYAFLQGGFGRVELGGNTGAEEALSVNTSTFASATGGVDGDFYRYTVVPAGFAAITAPDLQIAASGNSGTNNESATKITYYTPRFSGFQAGVSYTPNTDATGIATPAAGAGTFDNIFSGGVNYSGQFDSVGVKAAATAITGSSNEKVAAAAADLEGWDVGANVTFSNITVGGSYGDYGDTLGANTDANYWDAGIGYAAGAFSASATYLASETDFGATSDEFDNLSVGVDYQLAPGLVPYVEASFFNYDDAVAAAQNEGTVVLVGSELTF